MLPAVQCLSTARLGGACVVDYSLAGVVQGNHSIVILCVFVNVIISDKNNGVFLKLKIKGIFEFFLPTETSRRHIQSVC